MKLPSRFEKQKLHATARRMPQPRVIDDYDQEPNMKLSSAFIVVLVLHVVAVGGIYAFNSIKAHRNQEVAAAATLPAAAAPAPSVAPSASSAKTAKAPKPAAAALDTSTRSYTVVKGDTLAGIARKFGVNREELLKLNKIDDPKKLQIGLKIRVPAKTAKLAAAARSDD